MGSGIASSKTARSGESDRMLSRVADSLYWMSRYLERAENTVRQLDVTMSLMLDTGGANVGDALAAHDGRARQAGRHGLERRPRGNGPQSWSSTASTPPRSPIASTGRAKTPARCAKKSPPSSGSGSTASITRCTRRTRNPSSVQHQRHARLGHRRHPPLQRRQRHHHDSRPGLAVHPPRPLP